MIDYQYAYLLIDLCLFPLWVFLFIRRPDLRKKILLLSSIVGFLGPFSEYWYLQDYWHPLTITRTAVGIEDILFGYFMGGISSVIYEELFGLRMKNRHTRKHHWSLLFFVFFGMGFFLLNVLFFYLAVNSIYASIIVYLLLVVAVLFFRRDLISDAVVSGLSCGGILLVTYLLLLFMYPNLFTKMWMLSHLSGIFIGKVPIEEIVWAMSWGMLCGPLYEFCTGAYLKRTKH